MSLIVKKSDGGGNFQPIDAGVYPARCWSIVDLGTHDTEYQGKARKRRTVRITWELPTERKDYGKGELESAVVGKTYTLSLGSAEQPSALRQDLESWRGRPFTSQEEEGFDISKLLGAPCVLTVAHKAKQTGGGFYAYVNAVGKPMKGSPVPDGTLSHLLYRIADGQGGSFQLVPEWMRKEILSSDEFKAPVSQPSDHQGPSEPVSEASEDDVPF